MLVVRFLVFFACCVCVEFLLVGCWACLICLVAVARSLALLFVCPFVCFIVWFLACLRACMLVWFVARLAFARTFIDLCAHIRFAVFVFFERVSVCFLNCCLFSSCVQFMGACLVVGVCSW